jgi:hypothetical protein
MSMSLSDPTRLEKALVIDRSMNGQHHDLMRGLL